MWFIQEALNRLHLQSVLGSAIAEVGLRKMLHAGHRPQ